MTLDEVLRELKAAGTAQNRKVYTRHGVQGDLYGVSYAVLGRLAHLIGMDQELARGLWATGNHDARVLATMVADPLACTSRELESWAGDLDNYVLTDALSGLVSHSRFAESKRDRWSQLQSEWKAAAGWNLVAIAAMRPEAPPESYFRDCLREIEQEIHDRPNRARHSMNQALIAIALRGPGLRSRALNVAHKIGRVEVDHGETGCRTPDAEAYIERTVEYRHQREEERAVRKTEAKARAKAEAKAKAKAEIKAKAEAKLRAAARSRAEARAKMAAKAKAAARTKAEARAKLAAKAAAKKRVEENAKAEAKARAEAKAKAAAKKKAEAQEKAAKKKAAAKAKPKAAVKKKAVAKAKPKAAAKKKAVAKAKPKAVKKPVKKAAKKTAKKAAK